MSEGSREVQDFKGHVSCAGVREPGFRLETSQQARNLLQTVLPKPCVLLELTVMSVGFKRCFRGIGKQRQIRWVAEGGMESPVVIEWGLSVMRILAVLQYKISYHINYIAMGSRVFCDSDLVYQKSQMYTHISDGVRDNLAMLSPSLLQRCPQRWSLRFLGAFPSVQVGRKWVIYREQGMISSGKCHVPLKN